MADRFVVVNPFLGHDKGTILPDVPDEYRHNVNKLPDEAPVGQKPGMAEAPSPEPQTEPPAEAQER